MTTIAERNKARAAARHEEYLSLTAEMENGCHHWLGSRFVSGYGRLTINGKTHRAHRYFYERAYGPIPAGMVIRHRCDNPICVRLDHLEIGTHADNKNDAVSRGRHARGEKQGRAKLTNAEALEIKLSSETSRSLAAKFGVSLVVVNGIKRGALWKFLAEGNHGTSG